MISNRIKLLAVSIIMLGAASAAFACGDAKKASSTEASYSSTEKAGDGCCAMKGTKASTVAAAKDGCAAKMASGECSAKMASKECAAHMKAGAMADGGSCAAGAKSAGLAYGASTVTLVAGACPAKGEADYAFYVAGAECKGTGTSAVQAIKGLKGVASVTADYEKHMIYVCADSRTAGRSAIEKSLKNAGFEEVKFVNASKQNCSKSHGKVQA